MIFRNAPPLELLAGRAAARQSAAGRPEPVAYAAVRPAKAVQRGFTLIELLLVMTLMGIATTLAVSGLDKFAIRARDQSWADKVRVELVRLRNKAVLSGQPARADIIYATGELRAAGDDVATPRLRLPAQFAFLPAGLAVGLSDLSSEQSMPIDFFPDGAASEASFLLRDPDGKLTRFHVRGLTGKISSGDPVVSISPLDPTGSLGLPAGADAMNGVIPPPSPPPAVPGGAFGFGAAPADGGAPH